MRESLINQLLGEYTLLIMQMILIMVGIMKKGTNFVVDVGLSVVPVASEYKTGATIGKFVLSKGSREISVTAIKSKGAERFLTGIIENLGEKNSISLSISGFDYTYTKFGTAESIIKTAYNGLDSIDLVENYAKGFYEGLFADKMSEIYFNYFYDI